MDMDDFIQRQGPAYLAHLLGRLHDELVRGAEQWYPDMGVTVSPRATSSSSASRSATDWGAAASSSERPAKSIPTTVVLRGSWPGVSTVTSSPTFTEPSVIWPAYAR